MTVRSSATSSTRAIGVQRGRASACLFVIVGLLLLALALPATASAQDTPPAAPNIAAAGGQTPPVAAAAPRHEGGEANLQLPDLSQVRFVGGLDGRMLLKSGLLISLLGLAFGFMMANQLRNLPVHRSMLEISDLIYETCKTYLITQGKFILLLELFIGTIILLYFGVLLKFEAVKVAIILAFSL